MSGNGDHTPSQDPFLRSPVAKLGIDLFDVAAELIDEQAEMPKRIRDFEVLDRIGMGSSSVVYKARRIGDLDRLVAIKVILDGGQPGAVLLREIQSQNRLQHPNIVRAHESFQAMVGARELPCIVMDYVTGPVLTEGLEGTDIRARVRAMIAVCDALVHAHQNGVIHRDLKPSNVRTHRDVGTGNDERVAIPHPVVLDFGIALVRSDPDLADAREPTPVGTLAYMAPEQFRVEHSYADVRSDVYSLGVLLHEILTGKAAFALEGMDLAAKLHSRREHIEPLGGAPSLPRDLRAIIRCATQPNPEDRYRSVAQLREDLTRWCDRYAVRARGRAPVYRVSRPIVRHPVVAALALLIMSIVLATTIHTIQREIENQAEAHRQAGRYDRTLNQEIERLSRPVWSNYFDEDKPGIFQKSQDAFDELTQTIASSRPRFSEFEALVYERQADLLEDDGDVAKKLRLCERAEEIRERIAQQQPDNLDAQLDYIISIVRLGDTHGQLSDRMEATPYYEQALGFNQALVTRYDTDEYRSSIELRRVLDDLLHSHLRLAYAEQVLAGEPTQTWDRHIDDAERVLLRLEKLFPEHPLTHHARSDFTMKSMGPVEWGRQTIEGLQVAIESAMEYLRARNHLAYARRMVMLNTVALSKQIEMLPTDQQHEHVRALYEPVQFLMLLTKDTSSASLNVSGNCRSIVKRHREVWTEWAIPLEHVIWVTKALQRWPMDGLTRSARLARYARTMMQFWHAAKPYGDAELCSQLRGQIDKMVVAMMDEEPEPHALLLHGYVLGEGGHDDRAAACELTGRAIQLLEVEHDDLLKEALLVHALVLAADGREVEVRYTLQRAGDLLDTPSQLGFGITAKVVGKRLAEYHQNVGPS